jgi:chromosome segregation ATPase
MRAGMARLEADVTSLSVAVARMERDIASVRGSIDSLEARLRQDHSDRQDLRDQLLDCRRRLGELEERVQAIEGQLPRG